jgi:hypothetical protein
LDFTQSNHLHEKQEDKLETRAAIALSIHMYRDSYAIHVLSIFKGEWSCAAIAFGFGKNLPI